MSKANENSMISLRIQVALPLLFSAAILFSACEGQGRAESVAKGDSAAPGAGSGVEEPMIQPDSAAIAATPQPKSGVDADSARKALAAMKRDVVPLIHYTSFHIANRSDMDSIRKRFGRRDDNMAAHRALITLNRKEFGYIRVGDTIVVPDSVSSDLRDYSVFPQRYHGADTIRKLVMVSNAMQAYACYEYGYLVRFAACNTGTESKATFPGRYAMNWKERLRTSSLNENWKLPYNWNFHLYAGNAFHQFTMPGRPVSHSCVRQFMTDAEWLFNWGEGGIRDANNIMIPLTGTPVIIIDVFDFNRKKGGPWLELTSNQDGILKLPDAPMGVEEALIPISQVPSAVRGGLKDRARYEGAEKILRERGLIRPEARLSPSIDYIKLRGGKNAKKPTVKRRKPAAAPAATPTVSNVGGGSPKTE
jgi:hypothetical protein